MCFAGGGCLVGCYNEGGGRNGGFRTEIPTEVAGSQNGPGGQGGWVCRGEPPASLWVPARVGVDLPKPKGRIPGLVLETSVVTPSSSSVSGPGSSQFTQTAVQQHQPAAASSAVGVGGGFLAVNPPRCWKRVASRGPVGCQSGWENGPPSQQPRDGKQGNGPPDGKRPSQQAL